MLPDTRLWSARSAPNASVLPSPSSRAPAVAVALTLALLLALAPWSGSVAAASSATITGTVFQDLDRDAVRGPGEPGFAGHRLDLYDADGAFVRWVDTDADGGFVFTGLAPGTYELRTRSSTWLTIRDAWVPTTTGSLLPRQRVEVGAGTVTADLGWRPIVTSADVAAPISQVTGPEGLRVQSYNDVVTAQELYDHVAREFRIGDEAPHTTIRFGYSSTSMANASIVGSQGDYRSITILVWVSYRSWLDQGDRTLAHEYGHAFGEFHTTMVQQDRTWAAYLEARGLADDDRVGTSYAWLPTELIAEDYRQLFASDNAATGGQINMQVPLARDVPGLAQWLDTTFVGLDGPDEAPEPDDDPASEPDPDAEPDPGSGTEPSPSPDPDTPTTDPVDEPAPDPGQEEDGNRCHPRRGCEQPAADDEPTPDAPKKCHPVRGC